MKPKSKSHPTQEELYRVIEALMEVNDNQVTEIQRLRKELSERKFAAPSITVLRALAIYGD